MGFTNKRGSTWTAYWRVDGKQKSKGGFKTKKDALIFISETENKIRTGEYSDHANLTVEQFLVLWLKNYASKNVRSSTYQTYVWSVNKAIPAIGSIQLAKLKPSHIQTFYTEQLDTGLSGTSVRYFHSTLKQAFKHAVKWQLLIKNPCESTEPPSKNKSTAQSLNAEQVVKLIEGSVGTKLYIPILLAVTCGLRRGEVCGLRWQDFNFNTKDIYIRNSLDWEDSKLTLRTVKTSHSERAIKLGNKTFSALKKHHTEQTKIRLQWAGSYNNQDFVITWTDGRPFSPDYLQKEYKKLLVKLKLPPIRFHDLRHTHATLLLQEGVPVKVVSERLGHSSTSFTQDIYSHVLPNMQQSAANAFDNLMKAKKKGTSK